MVRRAAPLALIVVFGFLLGGSMLAKAMAARAWTRFVSYETPFTFAPEGAAGEPLVERVVIVLVDGLTVRASRAMPFLGELRARGADLEGRAGQPSLSLPGRGVILSGAWSEVHGQTTNFRPRPLAVEHLFGLARAHGRSTALAAGPSPHRLVSPHVSAPVVFTESDDPPTMAGVEAEVERRVDAAARLLRESRAELAMVELVSTDVAGHGWGAASPEYAHAAALSDGALRRLAAEVDLATSVLVVTADHGHVARGGHGGGEDEVLAVPVVIAGGPVRRGSSGRCRQVDLAPTLALLLGLPPPASSQGRPLVEPLVRDEAAGAAARRAHAAQRQRVASRYAAWLAGAGPAPAAGPDEAGPEAQLAAAEAREDAARRERMARDRRGRMFGAVLLFLALPLLLVLARLLGVGGREAAAALLGAAAALALYHALFPVLGLGYSFTLVNKDEELGLFFRKDMMLAVAAVAAAVAGTAALWRRTGAGPWELARLAALLAASFTGLLWMRIAGVHVLEGVFAHWRLPDIRWAFAFYLDVLAAMAVGFAGPVLAGLAALAGHLAGRRSARMEA